MQTPSAHQQWHCAIQSWNITAWCGSDPVTHILLTQNCIIPSVWYENAFDPLTFPRYQFWPIYLFLIHVTKQPLTIWSAKSQPTLTGKYRPMYWRTLLQGLHLDVQYCLTWPLLIYLSIGKSIHWMSTSVVSTQQCACYKPYYEGRPINKLQNWHNSVNF